MTHTKPDPAVGWNELVSALSEKRCLISLTLLIWMQASGIDIITQYAPNIVATPSGNADNDAHDVLLSTLWVGLILVVTTPLPMCFIDTYGRRPLLIFGAIG